MNEITSAQDAIETAEKFLEPYYPWLRPVKAVREGDTWLVEFDVGAVKVDIASVKINALSREVKKFSKSTLATQSKVCSTLDK